MIRFYLLFSLFLCSFTATAQGLPGYVITAAGDTLQGEVTESYYRIQFSAAGSSTQQQFSPDDIKGYGLRGQSLVQSRLVKVAGEPVRREFVLLQQQGPASLYSLADDTGLLLLPPQSDTLFQLTATNWHLLFNRYLNGCATIQQTSPELLELPFSEGNVKRILFGFNRCLQPEWKPATSANKAAWQKGAGVRLSIFQPLVISTGYQWSGMARQVGFNGSAVRASGLQVDYLVEYSHHTALTEAYTIRPSVDERQKYKLDLLTLSFAVGKRFGHSDLPRLYTGAGLGFNYCLSERKEIQQRGTNGSYTFQPVLTNNTSGGLAMHLDLIVGTAITLAPQSELRLNAFYRSFLFDSSLLGIQVGYIRLWR